MPAPRVAAALFALALASGLSDGAWAQSAGKTELAPGVTFEVTELRRLNDKQAMSLKFAITNTGNTPTTARKLGLATEYRLDGIEIIDFTNKRSFGIGSASRCLCSTFDDGGVVAPGGRREFWAWYALPPAGVQTVSIQLADKPPIQDVPLN